MHCPESATACTQFVAGVTQTEVLTDDTDPADWVAFVYNAAAKILTNSDGNLPNVLMVGTDYWKKLGALTDSTGRPLFPNAGAMNAFGQQDAASFNGNAFGLQVVVDRNFDPLTVNLSIDLAANAPVMKVADFFAGILKVFNMTVYSITDGEYWVEPLDDWYSKGAVIDISKYTDVSTIEHTRMPLYKKITFKFQDSECFLNKTFSQTFNKNYGDTTYQYNYDGGEFTVEVPFENLLQQKFNGTQQLQVGYSLNSEYTPYIPKPVLLYQYENLDCQFAFSNDGSGHTTVTNYTPFGQDLLYNNTDFTLNFAPETSTILDYPIANTLFANYYFSYLYNLYNIKQRLVNVKAKLPVSLLTGLQLNDRLIIRDRRYIINEIEERYANY